MNFFWIPIYEATLETECLQQNLLQDAVLGKPVPMKPSFILLCEQLVQILPEVSGVAQKGDGDARSGSHTVNPKWLLNALTKRCPQFEGGDQHDAHELLRHLLDSVHSEDLRVRKVD